MLFGSITVLALLYAVWKCLTVGLTAMPMAWIFGLNFAAFWLTGVAAALVFLVAVSYIVDPKKEPEKDSPFYRFVIALYIEALIMLVRVRIRTKGMEKTPKDGRFLLVCNHQFIADPGVILHCFRKSQLAFISKKENRNLFCIGRLMHKILCQQLDREDDRQALRVILKCIQILKEDKASIAVFPEGGTNHDELLHPLRPGVFKIAQKANVPIVVCTVRNTRPIFKNLLRRGTEVELRLLDVIPAEELKGITTVEIADRVHRMMAQDLGPELVAQ